MVGETRGMREGDDRVIEGDERETKERREGGTGDYLKHSVAV